MTAALALAHEPPPAPPPSRKLASGSPALSSQLAPALPAMQPANDTGKNRRCACDLAAESLIWVSKDPSLFRGGWNLYAYCDNDPVDLVDRTGRGPEGAALGALVGGAIGGYAGFWWGAAGGAVATAESGPGVVAGAGAGAVAGAGAGMGIGALAGGVLGSGIEDALGWVSDWASKKGSKPKGCPVGTVPISGTKWSKEHERIKRGVGAGPRDWTGITPDGHVVTGDEDGNAQDHGPVEDYLP